MRAYSFYARARALRIESLIDTRITSMRLGSNDTNKCTLGIAYLRVYHTDTYNFVQVPGTRYHSVIMIGIYEKDWHF